MYFHGNMCNIMLTVTYVGCQQQGNPLLHLPWWQQWLHESPTMLNYTHVVHIDTNSWQITAQQVSLFLTDYGIPKLVTVFTAACCASSWCQYTSSQPVFNIHQIEFSNFTYIFHPILWHQFLVYMFLNFMTISSSNF